MHSIQSNLFCILEALKEILMAFEIPENRTRMDEARDSAGNDMLKMMQTVFPIATQIQMQVIPKYGFPGDGEGRLCKFTFSPICPSDYKGNLSIPPIHLSVDLLSHPSVHIKVHQQISLHC